MLQERILKRTNPSQAYLLAVVLPKFSNQWRRIAFPCAHKDPKLLIQSEDAELESSIVKEAKAEAIGEITS